MAGTKWTPGPWKIEEGTSIEKGEVCFRIVMDGDKWLTDLVCSDSPELRERGWAPVAEQEANAYLIAAAPALAAALRAVVGILDDCKVTQEEILATWDQVRAALTLAEKGGA